MPAPAENLSHTCQDDRTLTDHHGVIGGKRLVAFYRTTI